MTDFRPFAGLGGRGLAVISVLAAILAAPVPTRAHDSGDPADPGVAGAALRYQPVLGDYAPMDIVEVPRDWRAANDEARELDGPRGQLLMPGETPPPLPKQEPAAEDAAADDDATGDDAADDAAKDPNSDAAIAAEGAAAPAADSATEDSAASDAESSNDSANGMAPEPAQSPAPAKTMPKAMKPKGTAGKAAP